MAKNLGKWTAAAAGLAGAGAAVVLAKKAAQNKQEAQAESQTQDRNDYRNTELGRHEKNSKGIYYTNGNYEAFARPEKPAGVEEKSAYIVGSGLAALAAACFLVRDGQMPGDRIHILEAMDVAGGACDGIFDPSRGYVMRGGHVHGCSRRRLRRHIRPHPRIYHAGRPGDGGPLRVPVGPVPLHSLFGEARHFGAG